MSSSIDNLFWGIPFSKEDRINTLAHTNFITARDENKGKSCLLFSFVLASYRKELSGKPSHFDRKVSRVNGIA